MTVYIALTCPGCNSTDLVRHRKTRQGKQRYFCRNQECNRRTFIRDYTNHGYQPEIKQKIGEMVINGSGIRDTARVLKISCQTVTSELKKKKHSSNKLIING